MEELIQKFPKSMQQLSRSEQGSNPIFYLSSDFDTFRRTEVKYTDFYYNSIDELVRTARTHDPSIEGSDEYFVLKEGLMHESLHLTLLTKTELKNLVVSFQYNFRERKPKIIIPGIWNERPPGENGEIHIKPLEVAVNLLLGVKIKKEFENNAPFDWNYNFFDYVNIWH